MFLGTGEVVPGRSKEGRRYHIEVCLNPPHSDDSGLQIAFRHYLPHPGGIYKPGDHRRGVIGSHHEVQVAHGLPAPAVAPRRLHPGSFVQACQVAPDLLDRHGSHAQQPTLLSLLHGSQPVQDLLFSLLADTRQFPQVLVPGSRLQLLEGSDVVVHEDLHRFRPNAGDLQHLQDIPRRLLFQVLIVCQPAGGHQFSDLGRQGATDARDLLQTTLPDQVMDVNISTFQNPGRVPVSPGLEGVFPKYFEDFCNLLENLADFQVGHAAMMPRFT